MKFSFFQIFVFSVSDVAPRVQDLLRKKLNLFLSLHKDNKLTKTLKTSCLLWRFHVIG